MTDNEFNKLLKNIHNRDSFEKIFDEYYPQIIKISLYLYGRFRDAEDVAQEIFTYLLTHEVKTYINNPNAWFYALCKYNGQKLFKKELPLDENVCYAAPIKEFVSLDMQVAFSKLTPEETDIIILIWYYGFSLEEVATTIHKTYSAIAKQHERIKKKLRNILST